jgi:hypothetical protein
MVAKANPYRILVLASTACLFFSGMWAQEDLTPRQPTEAERAARELFSAGEYGRAVPMLEKAVTAHPDNLTELSLLGMAYLYSSSQIDMSANLGRAQQTMDKVVEKGGTAVFLVGRGDDSLKSQIKFLVKAIQGELRIGKESLSFVPSRGATGGTGAVSKGDLKECGLNKSYGKDSNAFHIKTAKETIHFRPLHFSKEESDLACTLSAKYLGAKIVN